MLRKVASSSSFVLLVSLMIAFSAVFTPPLSAQIKDDKGILQGEWKVVSGESRSGSGEIVGESITFSGDTFTHWSGSIKFNADFSLNSSKSPKQIDFKNAIGTVDPGTGRGPVEKRTLHGIYEIKGDELRLCIDESATGRPSKFAGSGLNVMLILKRK